MIFQAKQPRCALVLKIRSSLVEGVLKVCCCYLSLYIPRSRSSSSALTRTLKVSHIRRSVLTVMGLPASICCQWRAENPKPIMSSCVYLRALRRLRTRSPSARKNRPSSITASVLESYEQEDHEQISSLSSSCLQKVVVRKRVQWSWWFFGICSSQRPPAFAFSNS